MHKGCIMGDEITATFGDTVETTFGDTLAVFGIDGVFGTDDCKTSSVAKIVVTADRA